VLLIQGPLLIQKSNSQFSLISDEMNRAWQISKSEEIHDYYIKALVQNIYIVFDRKEKIVLNTAFALNTGGRL
jgi:hypothetical protein